MNTAFLKAYAPKARLAFINAVKDRAANLGITHTTDGLQIMAMDIKGDVILMNGQFSLLDGQAIDAKLLKRRNALQQRLEQHGYTHVIEQIAYTWFNRFVAIRYMELHAYLDHGYRVLSHPSDKAQPEIIEHAEHADLPDLNKADVIQLKLDGTQDEKLYRLLLIAQCNALHHAMPFLFEKIDDETELLLPNNLLHSDSLIRQLVSAIPESDWDNIEIIGWLYQFYISDKKDQVIGKVVKSEDIPAATQLFTPNWIVKYLVQNSLGRQWLAVYPDSSLKATMDYYISPAEQSPEVNAALAAITPSTLDPESLTVIDPAMGSGHILVEAYDLLKAIYLERGYSLRDIPVLILKNNLYGLDIDDRAAQLAMFALMMKARADDRRIFSRELSLNLLHLHSSADMDAEMLGLNCARAWRLDYDADEQSALQSILRELLAVFAQAETVGSLIQIPASLREYLPTFERAVARLEVVQGDYLQEQTRLALIPLVQQAMILARRYDVVVANPPYMGNKYITPSLKSYLKEYYKGSEKDLFSAFMMRNLSFAKETGQLGFMTPFVWMFISSYENLRNQFINHATITSLIQPELHAFFDSAFVSICCFTVSATHLNNYTSSFIRLTDFYGADLQPAKTLEAIKNNDCGWFYTAKPDDFNKIPSSPIAYWIKGIHLFQDKKIGDIFVSGGRNKTHNNEKYLRFFWEISKNDSNWVSYANGGDFRKYAGNELQVVNWSIDARNYYESNGGLSNEKFWGKEGITWSLITSAINSFRVKSNYSFYSSGSPTIFNSFFKCDNKALAFLNSPISNYYLKAINPTMNTTVGDVFALPFADDKIPDLVNENIKNCISISKTDWNNYETSWDFTENPLIRQQQNTIVPTLQRGNAAVDAPASCNAGALHDEFPRQSVGTISTLKHCFNQWQTQNRAAITEMQRLEQENNRLFIAAYGLQDELSPDVPEDQITLTRADREKDCQRLISYVIGCMMGRYRLDKAGLIYAHAGNVDFDSIYTVGADLSAKGRMNSPLPNPFPADADGIVVMTNEQWFTNDAAERLSEFLRAVWGEKNLSENTAWLAESLGQKANETPDEAIRRYLSTQFYKDHLKTYKKRPIYWLFSSGKHKAFEALVYLHRYHEGSLARMRMEYVIPLQSRMRNQLDKLQDDINAASSTAHAKKAQKQKDTLTKQYTELLTFDEQLRHYADQRIQLDLDDGVKVNYAKFRPLLAEVKLVTDKSGGD
jgi:hypothetical protein